MQIILKVAFICGQGWEDCNALGVWGPKKEEKGPNSLQNPSKYSWNILATVHQV